MEPSKIAALLLISVLSVASAVVEPQCGYCSKPHPKKKPKSPITLPPIVRPPITLPPVVPVPKLPVPPVTVPKVPIPPVTVPKVPIPPVTVPPVTVPPVVNPPTGKPCTPPPGKATCPIDTLKLGACVDLLGGLVHIGLGDPAVNECCPMLSGLVELEAAACLCTTLKIKALNLKIYVPLALQLLVTCGKTPPPGYTCSL
ncbi:UNVERIFIED_CONTAM: proline-rich protein [Sesamum radiatum]|uniref:Proline-rich protein n=1 Tax=Sesamum radiatum TaxID=300843 RepID=A0AAW2LAH8_SESRA